MDDSPPPVCELVADPARQPEWDGNVHLAQAPAGRRVTAVGDVFTWELVPDAPEATLVRHTPERLMGSIDRLAAFAESGRSSR